jgi:hypothetical protein
MKNIVIINRYYPPNPAISGHSACEMVWEISKRKKQLKMLARFIHAPYAGGHLSQTPAGILGGLTSVYNGKNKILRFVGNFIEGYRLVRLSLPYADAIITLTDPPMLNFWAGILCHQKKIPWIYWALDLYPDAFAAARIVHPKNAFYQVFHQTIKSYPPDFLIALGAQQAAFLKEKYQKNIASIILPCGIIDLNKSKSLPEWHSDSKTIFAYAGNMGEAHDPEFLIQLIQRMDPRKHICLLSLYGAKSGRVSSIVGKHPSVKCIDYIPREHLPYIDIHLVSLLPAWTHICVPSKAVSAICSGKAIAFQGSRQSDIWQMFNKSAFYVGSSHQPIKMSENLNKMLVISKDSQSLTDKNAQALKYRAQLFDKKLSAYDAIADYLQAC